MFLFDVTTKSGNIEGQKIRYIKYDNDNYLIYTLGEKDSEGYEKLYINKIVNNSEVLISDDEWDNLKKIIPPIVKEIKNNNFVMVQDLDIEQISEINNLYSRVFKLKIEIVNEITKKTEAERINLLDEQLEELTQNNEEKKDSLDKLDEFLKNPMIEEEIELPKKPVEEEKNNVEELEEKIKQLENEVQYYKNKLDDIKKLIED